MQTAAVPMRRNHQNGFGFFKGLRRLAEVLVKRTIFVQRIHRIAMTDK